MKLPRRAWVLLVLAVVVLALVVSGLGPRQTPAASCGVHTTTLAVEVCPPGVVETILADLGPDGRARLRRQTIADFALIVAYVGLWGATGLVLHPALGALVVLAGAADVVENLGILRGLAHPEALPLVRWAGLTKWTLLGLAFIAFAALFRLDRASGRWPSRLRAATGLAYGVTGVAYVAGVADLRLVGWAMPVMIVAVVLQLALHVAAHGEFEAQQDRRARDRPPTSLSVETVLAEEYECLHGPLGAAVAAPGLGGLYEAIYGLAEKRSALCLSGGGIRSATFALGVLQGLARVGVLPRFHYLSTVSGGGYIGGWLTAWLHHSGNDAATVAAELATLRSGDKLSPEPSPVAHLRDYSNYLAPRPGLLSADTWTLIGTVVRNLILIWVVLVPLLAAALMVPRLYLALIEGGRNAEAIVAAVQPALLSLGAIGLAWAVAYIGASIPSSTTALRSQGQFLALCLAPLLLSLACLTLYYAWSPTTDWRLFVGFGVVVHLIAWIGYTAWLASPWGRARPSPGSRAQAVGAALAELAMVVVVGAVAGGLAAVLARLLFADVRRVSVLYACLAPGAFLGAFLLAATLLVGLISRFTVDEDREWWARSGAWTLITGVVWLVMSALVLFGPLLFSGPLLGSAMASVGGASGLIGVLGGWSARSAGRPGSATPASMLGRLGLPAAAAVFAAVLVVAVSLLTSGLLGWVMERLALPTPSGVAGAQWPDLGPAPLGHGAALHSSPPGLVLAVGAGLALLGIGAAWLINTNKFSLHAMYRARLIRAYLGASNLARHGNPFTGFDETDNIQMHELWPTSPPPPPDARRPARRPLFHVVNMALNLVHGDRLAWQERKAHSFTVSPLHAGSVAIDAGGGYRRTCAQPRARRGYYGGPRGVSLGTAVTISGAAASPNMGYHSSPLVTFLMTIFNVRLGWWLGNPGAAGEDTFYLASPRVTVRPIVAEAFGLTDRTAPYVYLSDGGHFDNLGLYEMVLRRCHLVVVSDASCDPRCGLSDLGGAIRKIRADLGIPIEFPWGIPIASRSAPPAEHEARQYWAVGRIRYSAVDPPPVPDAREARDGWLLYIKPAFYGREPADVYEYAMANQEFPHESTVDQFFSESQFESYRALGVHAVTRLCDGWGGGSLTDLFRHASATRPLDPSVAGPAR